MDPSTISTVHLPMVLGLMDIYNVRLPGPIPADTTNGSGASQGTQSKSSFISSPPDSVSSSALSATASGVMTGATTGAANQPSGGSSNSVVDKYI